MTPSTLATLFLDPMNLHDTWWLTLIPLAFFVAMAYKAVRVQSFDAYWKQVLMMTAQIVVAMIALAAALHLLVEIVVPAIG